MKKDHPSDCKQSSGISCWLMCVMFLILLLCFVSPYPLQTKHDSSTSTMCMLHFHVSIGDTNAIRSELVLPITDVGTYITVESSESDNFYCRNVWYKYGGSDTSQRMNLYCERTWYIKYEMGLMKDEISYFDTSQRMNLHCERICYINYEMRLTVDEIPPVRNVVLSYTRISFTAGNQMREPYDISNVDPGSSVVLLLSYICITDNVILFLQLCALPLKTKRGGNRGWDDARMWRVLPVDLSGRSQPYSMLYVRYDVSPLYVNMCTPMSSYILLTISVDTKLYSVTNNT